MKTLYLVRHAKSTRDPVPSSDRERPLAERGRRDAPKIGKRLYRRGVRPDLILSSPALRALSTAEIIARQLHYPRKHIVVDDRLYPGDAGALLRVIRGLDDKLARVMLIGHNPGLSDLAGRLCGEPTHLSTCAVAGLTFDAGAWSDIGSAALAHVTRDSPKGE